MTPQRLENRYWTIDALRGIAALVVVLFHVNQVTLAHSASSFAQAVNEALRFGFLGVSIFFVISGFVIAASLARDVITFGYFGKFVLKRSVRLDPTYWASIALDVTLTVIAAKLALSTTPAPDAKKIVLHLFYLQDLTGVGNIAAIYWTLCLEIQFYIVFCATLLIHNRLTAHWPPGQQRPNIKAWLFCAITTYSMLIAAQLVPSPLPGLFVTHWVLFAMGAAAYHWGIHEPAQGRPFVAIMLAVSAVIGCQIYFKGAVYALSLFIAFVTAIGLFIGARRGKLGVWLRNDVLLYLGARSYSIYLFHAIVGERAAEVLTQLIYPRLHLSVTDTLWSFVALLAGVAVSLVVAELAYRLIEYPSLMLSKRIRPAPAKAAVKPVAA